jgi:hypothetical protein
MTKMIDLGFSKGIIVETVVSTYNVDGQANAAPMGAVMESTQRMAIRLYTSSLTYKNLQSRRCAVVNLTSDPELYYRATFKEANPNGKMPQGWFEKAETVDAPRLRMADALIEVFVAEINSFDAKRDEALCDVKLVKASRGLPRVYCRALFATIEAIIHATRVKTFLNDNKQEQAIKLLEIIEYCHDVVNRVAPNSRYSIIMADLTRMVDSWRTKGESPC